MRPFARLALVGLQEPGRPQALRPTVDISGSTCAQLAMHYCDPLGAELDHRVLKIDEGRHMGLGTTLGKASGTCAQAGYCAEHARATRQHSLKQQPGTPFRGHLVTQPVSAQRKDGSCLAETSLCFSLVRWLGGLDGIQDQQ